MAKKNYDDMLSRFHLILEHHGQTDGWTDRQNCYIDIAWMHDKNQLQRNHHNVDACGQCVDEHWASLFGW